MISIFGANEGREYESAQSMKAKLVATWPELEASATDHVCIFVGYRIHKARVKELDIIMAADFKAPRSFASRSGNIKVSNFVILLEVKGHDPRNIEFSGGNALVRYSGEWKSATKQSNDQLHAFKKLLKEKGISIHYVSNLILFSQLRNTNLADGDFVASNTTIEQILELVTDQYNRYRNAPGDLNVATRDNMEKLFQEFKSISPTPLDRKKMDRIARIAWRSKWLDDIGHKQVIIRGRGGTGKTIALMQLADHAFRKQNRRSLLITYNKALVADLTRIKELSGIPDDVVGGGIRILTIHKVIRRLAYNLRFDVSDFLDRYTSIKEEICSHIDEGSLNNNDVQNLKHDDPGFYHFDILFVDEGQDWPDDEIKIVRWLFGRDNIVVADGVDQYVRGRPATNSIGWDRDLEKAKFVRRTLRKGLRMKNNLAVFMADVAWNCFGLDSWDVDPNDEAVGGRVIVFEGDLVSRPDIFQELCSQARNEGNFPVDMLACVPPGLVDRGTRRSIVGDTYSRHRIECWDGCSDVVRSAPPTSIEQLRIVQYESSRGLEGWTVFNFNFDEFWDRKFKDGLTAAQAEPETPLDLEAYARRYAGRWLMIPLSRAIDTLVINFRSGDSVIKRSLTEIYNQGGHDCIEWRKLYS